jgi:hypothetical protein
MKNVISIVFCLLVIFLVGCSSPLENISTCGYSPGDMILVYEGKVVDLSLIEVPGKNYILVTFEEKNTAMVKNICGSIRKGQTGKLYVIEPNDQYDEFLYIWENYGE